MEGVGQTPFLSRHERLCGTKLHVRRSFTQTLPRVCIEMALYRDGTVAVSTSAKDRGAPLA